MSPTPNMRFFYLVLIISLTACIHPIYGKRSIPFPTPLKQNPKELTAKDVLIKPQAQTLIVLDPGHGGNDYGTYSFKPVRYQEKHLTLTASRMVKNYLEEMGYRVTLTRTTDTFVALDKRAAFANARMPKLFVSIHFNSAPNKQASGVEIFYYKPKDNTQRTTKSRALATSILKQVIQHTHAHSRGIKHGNLAVIRETMMPAVLIEGGFVTNEDELHKIKSADYLKKLALGIAQGIRDYLKNHG